MEDHNLFLPPRWGIALQMLILTAAGFQIRLNGGQILPHGSFTPKLLSHDFPGVRYRPHPPAPRLDGSGEGGGFSISTDFFCLRSKGVSASPMTRHEKTPKLLNSLEIQRKIPRRNDFALEIFFRLVQ